MCASSVHSWGSNSFATQPRPIPPTSVYTSSPARPLEVGDRSASSDLTADTGVTIFIMRMANISAWVPVREECALKQHETDPSLKVSSARETLEMTYHDKGNVGCRLQWVVSRGFEMLLNRPVPRQRVKSHSQHYDCVRYAATLSDLDTCIQLPSTRVSCRCSWMHPPFSAVVIHSDPRLGRLPLCSAFIIPLTNA